MQLTQYLKTGTNQIELKTSNYAHDPKVFFIAIVLTDPKGPEVLQVSKP